MFLLGLFGQMGGERLNAKDREKVLLSIISTLAFQAFRAERELDERYATDLPPRTSPEASLAGEEQGG